MYCDQSRVFSFFFYFHPATLPWETLTVLQRIQIRWRHSKPLQDILRISITPLQNIKKRQFHGKPLQTSRYILLGIYWPLLIYVLDYNEGPCPLIFNLNLLQLNMFRTLEFSGCNLVFSIPLWALSGGQEGQFLFTFLSFYLLSVLVLTWYSVFQAEHWAVARKGRLFLSFYLFIFYLF